MDKNVKDAARDVEDAMNEQKHKAAADVERLKRDAVGDEMTVGEKARSHGNELKNRTQAELDKAKREIRDHT